MTTTPLPVRDRPLSDTEFEQCRLLLSTYRDGSGQYLNRFGFMPDFLAFERVTALVCGGETTENKSVFDVVVPGGGARKPFGVSCKMAAEQPQARPSWFMEMSNSRRSSMTPLTRGASTGRHHLTRWCDHSRLVESWHTDVQADFDVSGVSTLS